MYDGVAGAISAVPTVAIIHCDEYVTASWDYRQIDLLEICMNAAKKEL